MKVDRVRKKESIFNPLLHDFGSPQHMYTYIYIYESPSNIPVKSFFLAFGMKPKCAGTLPLTSHLESIFRSTGGAKWRRQHQMVQVFEVVAIRHLPHIQCGRKGEVKG